jgi:hypothetical protein
MSFNIRETKIAFGFKAQADLGTPNVDADLWLMTKTNPSLAAVEYQTEPDNSIGFGTDFVTTQYKNGKNVNFSIEKPLTSEFWAWVTSFCLGSSVKTGTGPWVYTCVPFDPIDTDNLQPPSFTFVEAIRPGAPSELMNRALVGCVVNDFTLTLEKGPTVNASRVVANCTGTGETIDENTLAIPGTFQTEHRLPSGSAAVTINGTNYITGGLIESIELGFNNNIRGDDRFFPGSGIQDGFAIGGRMEIGDRRTASLTLTARAQAGNPELTKLKNLTEGTAVITLTGDLISGADYHTTTITYHRVVFSSVSYQEADGLVTVVVNAQPLLHSANGLMTVVTKTNKDAIAE